MTLVIRHPVLVGDELVNIFLSASSAVSLANQQMAVKLINPFRRNSLMKYLFKKFNKNLFIRFRPFLCYRMF